MLKVSNHKCVRRLSDKSLRAAKTRNIVAVIAIALTTVLFTSLFTIVLSLNASMQQANFRQAGGDAHGTFKYLTWDQVEQLRQHPKIKESGARLTLGMPSEAPFNKAHVEVSYMEEAEAAHSFVYLEEGSLPEEGTDQVATDTRVLNLLGVEPKVGEQFTITYNLGNKPVTATFTLSGWWEYDEGIVASHVLVPRSYAEQVLEGYQRREGDITGTWTLDVMFANALHIQRDLEQVLADNGYQNTAPQGEGYIDIGVNWGYTGAQAASNADPMMVLAIAALLLLIIFTGYLIIYNVFQISVTNDIRFYGLLKTIGTTGKQLRQIIRRQAYLLSLAGIPIGLLLGYLLGAWLAPRILDQLDGVHNTISISPLIFIGAALFALFTVHISCHKPGRMAARVSPVEAVRYTEADPPGKGKSKGRRAAGRVRRASISQMALANLGRSKRKTLLTVLSLSLSVVLLNATYTFANGFDMDKYLNKWVVTDFIFGDAAYFQTGSGGFNEDRAVDEQAIADLQAQGLITEGGRIYGQTSLANFWVDEEYFRQSHSRFYDQQGMDLLVQNADRDEKGRLADDLLLYGMEELPLDHLTVVEGDLSKLRDPDGKYIAAVLETDDYDVPEMDSNPMQVGDAMAIRYQDKVENIDMRTGQPATEQTPAAYVKTQVVESHTEEYEVCALVTMRNSMGYRYYGTAQFVLNDQQFRQATGTADIMTYLFDVAPENSGAMTAFLEDYTTQVETQYDYESKQDYVEEFQGFRGIFTTLGTALSIIVGLVGLLNFINAVLTSIISRRHEFAVLQAIGMTGRQLKQMLMTEGIYYAGGSLLVSLALSCCIAPLLGASLGKLLWFFTFHFTLLPILAVLPFFVLFGLAIPLMTYQATANQSIVERIRAD